MWLRDSQLSAASIPELLEFLDSSHYGRRAQAARELANRKEQPAVVWPRMTARRADESWMVRMQIPRAAIHLGVAAELAVPLLRELLGDEHDVVRGYAAWALRRLGETEGVPPEDDTPPELVVHGEIPELRGQVCQELVIQQLCYGDEIADEVSSVWMRFADQWYRVKYDCILYWQAEESGPKEGPWEAPSQFGYRLQDLAQELSLRGVSVADFVAEPKPSGVVIRFEFANGIGLEFDADLDEMVYRRTGRCT
jgi:hypothetical protein